MVDNSIDGQSQSGTRDERLVALKLLMTKHHERLTRRIAHKIPPFVSRFVAVEDIINETYFQAFNKIMEFEQRGTDADYRWLATIALNNLRNKIRHHKLRDSGRRTNAPKPGDANSDRTDLSSVPAEQSSPSSMAFRVEADQMIQIGRASCRERV